MEFSSAALLKEAKSFHLKKELGQHFLVDADVLRTIADALEATARDTIIEVGPGIGFLTRLLAQTGARVVAVDLDRESIGRLQNLNLPNVELKHGDFLRFDLNTLEFFTKQKKSVEEQQRSAASGQSERLKVIGNVPYQITGLILGHVLGEIDRPSPWLPRISNIVLTVQREVAERMVADAGSDAYSRVSLLVSYFCHARILQIVPPDAFYPPPEVTSAVIQLIPREQPAVACSDTHLLKQIIDAGFRQRRKMLRNSLSFLGFSAAEIESLFRRHAIDPQVRAERLSIQQFAMLADAIHSELGSHAQNKSAGSSENQPHV